MSEPVRKIESGHLLQARQRNGQLTTYVDGKRQYPERLLWVTTILGFVIGLLVGLTH